MLKMTDLIGRELKWIQPSALQMAYALQAGDTVAATLRFRSSLGSFATAESADGIWTFKRVGFWNPKVTIRAEGSDHDLGLFKNNTWHSGGTLELPDGRKFPANTNFWATKYEFKTETGELLVSYSAIGGVLHMSSAVTIPAHTLEMAQMPWIVPLGWYLAVMMYMDSAAAVVVAAT
jgi:hypothetical protein